MTTSYSLDAQTFMVEGRLIASDTGLLLIQPTSVSGFGLRELWGRIGMAIVIGGVLAAIAGALLARRVTRPLRTLVNAARRLQVGDRNLRLEPEGPAEIADLAVALNQLGDSLATSESRQRDFLLSVSHELRTPMTAIGGYAEALADGVVAEEDMERVAGTMLAETHRLDALIADLLDLARLGAVEFRWTSWWSTCVMSRMPQMTCGPTGARLRMCTGSCACPNSPFWCNATRDVCGR